MHSLTSYVGPFAKIRFLIPSLKKQHLMITIRELFNDMQLFEPEHEYKSKVFFENKYVPVTSVKSRFTQEFREPYWLAHQVLKRKGLRIYSDVSRAMKDCIYYNGNNYHHTKILEHYPEEVATISAEWNAKADEGRTRGNYIHEALERVALMHAGEPYNIEFKYPKKYTPYIVGAAKFWQHMSGKFTRLEPEVIVASHKHGIAGTCDLIDYPVPGRAVVDLYDYKGDEEIELSNKWANLKHPFQQFQASDLNEYAVQVSIYKALIETQTPYKVRNMTIVHIQSGGFTMYEFPDLSGIIKDYILC